MRNTQSEVITVAQKEVSKPLMRKVTFTKTGGRLVNLAGIVPEDWEYVDVQRKESMLGSIIVQIDLVRSVNDSARNTRKLQRPTKDSKPTT